MQKKNEIIFFSHSFVQCEKEPRSQFNCNEITEANDAKVLLSVSVVCMYVGSLFNVFIKQNDSCRRIFRCLFFLLPLSSFLSSRIHGIGLLSMMKYFLLLLYGRSFITHVFFLLFYFCYVGHCASCNAWMILLGIPK